MKIRIVSDWFNANPAPQGKVTAYIEDSKPKGGWDSASIATG